MNEGLVRKVEGFQVSAFKEKEFLRGYMVLRDYTQKQYEQCESCGTCNNCGSGNCSSCCGSTDD